jgi:uncharacterized Zn finger protein (UPF0148 family)
MTKIVCPKCNTQANNDTSFFCIKCGAQLYANIPEKKNARDLNFGMNVLKKESTSARDDSLVSRKPGSIERIKPRESCAHCGTPIIDKNGFFCTKCTAFIRDIPSREESPTIKHSVSESLDKKPVISPKIYQNTENKRIKKQEPVLIQGTSNPINPMATGWKSIIILAGIVFLFFMLMVMLIFTFWVSLY